MSVRFFPVAEQYPSITASSSVGISVRISVLSAISIHPERDEKQGEAEGYGDESHQAACFSMTGVAINFPQVIT